MSRDSIKNFVCRAGIEPALRVPQTLVLTIALTTPCMIKQGHPHPTILLPTNHRSPNVFQFLPHGF